MADILELIDRYFVGPADANPPSEPEPQTFKDSHVTPLIDGEAYFSELRFAIEALGQGPTPESNAEDFIYIAGWWVHLLGGQVRHTPSTSGFVYKGGDTGLDPNADVPPTNLACATDAETLIELLKAKSQMGVDVRVLGFVSASIMASRLARRRLGGVGLSENVGTMLAVEALREEPTLAKKACLNTIGHTAGTAHTKLVVLGNAARAIGFTGGMDLVSNRCSDELHTTGTWHDLQAKVEGPAVQGLYDFYRDIWNEVIAVSKASAGASGYPAKSFRVGMYGKDIVSVVPGTTDVPDRTLSEAPVGRHHVQSLRTVPNFSWVYSYATTGLPTRRPLSFAPKGLFEVRTAWRKAILAAERCIYMEDQFLWSVEVMQWINQSIKARPDLKVILMTGGKIDPGWESTPPSAYTPIAFLEGLLLDLDPAQIEAQIRVFVRDLIMHAKTTLVDDHWAIIGSANCDTRGLYTDFEHGVSVLDEDGRFILEYRRELWGGHFDGLPPEDRVYFERLDEGLNVWESSWGHLGIAEQNGVTLKPGIQRLQLPPDPLILDAKTRKYHERVEEPDSREPWAPPIYPW